MAKKTTESKATDKKPEPTSPKKSKYGHLFSAKYGYIDTQLEAGKSVEDIVKEWNTKNPKAPMNAKHVIAHIKHLVAKHGFSQKTADQVLAKEVKEAKS